MAARDPRDGYTAEEMNAMVRGDTTPQAIVAHTSGREVYEILLSDGSFVEVPTVEEWLRWPKAMRRIIRIDADRTVVAFATREIHIQHERSACPMCWRSDGSHVLGCPVEQYIEKSKEPTS